MPRWPRTSPAFPRSTRCLRRLPAKTRYFTVVASFETERGAMRRLNELRASTARRWRPSCSRPAGRRGKHWTVVTASFTDFTSANARTREAAETRAALDAYVVGMKALDWGDRHFVVHPPSVDLADAAGLVAQGPLPAVLQDANHLVLLSSHPALAEAERAAAILEDQFNRLKLSILKAPDGAFGVALATFVSAADAERALNIAARMGLQALRAGATHARRPTRLVGARRDCGAAPPMWLTRWRNVMRRSCRRPWRNSANARGNGSRLLCCPNAFSRATAVGCRRRATSTPC